MVWCLLSAYVVVHSRFACAWRACVMLTGRMWPLDASQPGAVRRMCSTVCRTKVSVACHAGAWSAQVGHLLQPGLHYTRARARTHSAHELSHTRTHPYTRELPRKRTSQTHEPAHTRELARSSACFDRWALRPAPCARGSEGSGEEEPPQRSRGCHEPSAPLIIITAACRAIREGNMLRSAPRHASFFPHQSFPVLCRSMPPLLCAPSQLRAGRHVFPIHPTPLTGRPRAHAFGASRSACVRVRACVRACVCGAGCDVDWTCWPALRRGARLLRCVRRVRLGHAARAHGLRAPPI